MNAPTPSQTHAERPSGFADLVLGFTAGSVLCALLCGLIISLLRTEQSAHGARMGRDDAHRELVRHLKKELVTKVDEKAERGPHVLTTKHGGAQVVTINGVKTLYVYDGD